MVALHGFSELGARRYLRSCCFEMRTDFEPSVRMGTRLESLQPRSGGHGVSPGQEPRVRRAKDPEPRSGDTPGFTSFNMNFSATPEPASDLMHCNPRKTLSPRRAPALPHGLLGTYAPR